jgi:hypothetical protein
VKCSFPRSDSLNGRATLSLPSPLTVQASSLSPPIHIHFRVTSYHTTASPSACDCKHAGVEEDAENMQGVRLRREEVWEVANFCVSRCCWLLGHLTFDPSPGKARLPLFHCIYGSVQASYLCEDSDRCRLSFGQIPKPEEIFPLWEQLPLSRACGSAYKASGL